MIEVSLLEFLRTGVFGPVRFGMDRSEVKTLLGDPNSWGGALGKNRRDHNNPEIALIWEYGNIEFHFHENKLFLIYEDAFDTLDGGTSIKLDPWIIRGKIARTTVTSALRKYGVRFQEAIDPLQDGIHVITSGGIELSFTEESRKYGWPRGLFAISHIDPKHSSTRRSIPLAFQRVGQIEHFWERPGVVGIRLLENASLQSGQRVAFQVVKNQKHQSGSRNPFAYLENFREQIVEELLVEYVPVKRAAGGELATLKTGLTKDQARNGVEVYLVSARYNWPVGE